VIPAALNVASSPSPVIPLTPTTRPATPPLAEDPVGELSVPVVAGTLIGEEPAASGALTGDVAGVVAGCVAAAGLVADVDGDGAGVVLEAGAEVELAG
jgi:hypothetical protein